jgi:hypothetical protein
LSDSHAWRDHFGGAHETVTRTPGADPDHQPPTRISERNLTMRRMTTAEWDALVLEVLGGSLEALSDRDLICREHVISDLMDILSDEIECRDLCTSTRWPDLRPRRSLDHVKRWATRTLADERIFVHAVWKCADAINTDAVDRITEALLADFFHGDERARELNVSGAVSVVLSRDRPA